MVQPKRTFYLIFIIVVTLVVMFCNTAFAQPVLSSISGTLNHGNTLAINGSGFGTKSPAAPYVWADFEQGNLNPSSLGVVTTWDSHEIRPENTYFNSDCPAGNGCLGYTFPGSGQHRIGATVDVPDGIDYPGRKIIQIRKVKVTGFNVEEVIDGLTWNVKIPIRAWSSGYIENQKGYSNLYIQAGTPNGNSQFGLEYCNTPSRDGQSCTQNANTPGYIYPNGTIVNEEFRMKASSHTAKDGSVYWKVGSMIIFNDVTVCTSCATPGGYPRTALDKPSLGRMGNDQSGHAIPAGAKFIEDNIYFDLTWSRVMLCNNATYASATLCEPQIPSAWDNTSIRVNVNLGGLPENGRAFLFVFDSDNNHNPVGRCVPLGNGNCTDSMPPSPPPRPR